MFHVWIEMFLCGFVYECLFPPIYIYSAIDSNEWSVLERFQRNIHLDDIKWGRQTRWRASWSNPLVTQLTNRDHWPPQNLEETITRNYTPHAVDETHKGSSLPAQKLTRSHRHIPATSTLTYINTKWTHKMVRVGHIHDTFIWRWPAVVVVLLLFLIPNQCHHIHFTFRRITSDDDQNVNCYLTSVEWCCWPQ